MFFFMVGGWWKEEFEFFCGVLCSLRLFLCDFEFDWELDIWNSKCLYNILREIDMRIMGNFKSLFLFVIVDSCCEIEVDFFNVGVFFIFCFIELFIRFVMILNDFRVGWYCFLIVEY